MRRSFAAALLAVSTGLAAGVAGGIVLATVPTLRLMAILALAIGQ